jgi:diguanylate cyclase (GGDEF)-like protein
VSQYSRDLWLRVFMLAIWLVLAAGAIGIIDPDRDSAALGVVAIAFVAGLSVMRPFPGSHLVIAALFGLGYAGLHGIRASAPDVPANSTHLEAAIVGVAAFAITAVLGDQIRRAIVGYDEELSARQRVIEEVQAVDAQTGAMKRAHAGRLLTQEVNRARRYSHNFSLVTVGPDDWMQIVEEHGQAEAEQLIAKLSAEYLQVLRTVDTLIHMGNADFTALLPETGLDGAQVVAEKLTEAGQSVLEVDVRAGISSFPEDEVTGDGLIREAEEARDFARTASIAVASRSLLT